ncbi:hypothetical protein [Lactococcus lactis]|uniref:hypothetical protein n=1 Tax=Lactococcus lactis TaxID=1358 RepID=UPI00288E3665|nr:hypothetical protein [Lactococcus lactis]MDT2938595.1 hypothetical protein [Lactococcus lactis]
MIENNTPETETPKIMDKSFEELEKSVNTIVEEDNLLNNIENDFNQYLQLSTQVIKGKDLTIENLKKIVETQCKKNEAQQKEISRLKEEVTSNRESMSITRSRLIELQNQVKNYLHIIKEK